MIGITKIQAFGEPPRDVPYYPARIAFGRFVGLMRYVLRLGRMLFSAGTSSTIFLSLWMGLAASSPSNKVC